MADHEIAQVCRLAASVRYSQSPLTSSKVADVTRRKTMMGVPTSLPLSAFSLAVIVGDICQLRYGPKYSFAGHLSEVCMLLRQLFVFGAVFVHRTGVCRSAPIAHPKFTS